MVTTSPAPPVLPPVDASRQSASIEGLRALAALWVVCSHLWISEFGLRPHRGFFGLASNWLLYSHLAVDVFIVLSGYCLSLAVVRDGGLRGNAAGFWRRRARRILPPLYCALALSVAILLILQGVDGVPLRVDWAALGVNLVLLQDIFLKDNVFNGPFWSVAVEWRLSLVFPLLVWLLRRSGVRVLLLATACVGYSLTAVIFRWAPETLMACPWYLLLFALGMWAALAGPTHDPEASQAVRFQRWALGVGASVLLVWALRSYPVAEGGVAFGLHMPLTDAAVGVLAALLLSGLRCVVPGQESLGMRLLSRPPLVGLGRFSYSIYLTHAPLLRLLERLLRFLPFWGRTSTLLKSAILLGTGLPLIVGLAYLFFLACERPFMTRKRSVSAGPLRGITLSYISKALCMIKD